MPKRPFEAYQGIDPFVFVSYAHADENNVYGDLLQINQKGYRVWYDEGINPAEEWTRTISQRLMTSKIVIVYLSKNALASKWVARELGMAVRKEREILPVYLEPLTLPDEWELQIGHLQAIHRHSLSHGEFLQQLAKRLDTIPEIRQFVAEDSATRTQRELKSLAEIQKRMLSPVPTVAGYSVAAMMEPYADAGGDLYDFHQLPTGDVLVFVADIAGKGIPAAIGMGTLAGIITMGVKFCGPDLRSMVNGINAGYFRQLSATDRFATLMAVSLDTKTHRICCVNAGHVPAMVRRRDGSLQDLVDKAQSGFPLGILEEVYYEEATTELGPGDMVLIFTDGIIEAPDAQRTKSFGLDRLKTLIAGLAPDPVKVVDTLMAELRAFTGGTPLYDDTTLVCFCRDA